MAPKRSVLQAFSGGWVGLGGVGGGQICRVGDMVGDTFQDRISSPPKAISVGARANPYDPVGGVATQGDRERLQLNADDAKQPDERRRQNFGRPAKEVLRGADSTMQSVSLEVVARCVVPVEKRDKLVLWLRGRNDRLLARSPGRCQPPEQRRQAVV
jgi:hypothetical protein